MFNGKFLIQDCIEVTYKPMPVNRLVFTFKHLGQPRPQYQLAVRMVGDIHVSLSAVNCTGLGEAEMVAAMMLSQVATQLSLTIKYRLYGCYASDPDNFVWGDKGSVENVAHALFYESSRAIPESMRLPFPRRVHERLHRLWRKGKGGATSEQALGLIAQPGPICPLIERHVWEPDAQQEIIALVHQLRDWGQSWKNLAKTLLPSRV